MNVFFPSFQIPYENRHLNRRYTQPELLTASLNKIKCTVLCFDAASAKQWIRASPQKDQIKGASESGRDCEGMKFNCSLPPTLFPLRVFFWQTHDSSWCSALNPEPSSRNKRKNRRMCMYVCMYVCMCAGRIELWHVDPLVDNDHETRNYTTAIAR
jgi:hypothetical protein